MTPGYVYLLGFENGKVKVGSSRSPQTRIIMHRVSLGKISPIIGEWVSPLHEDFRWNERRIVGYMGGDGEIATADFSRVLRYAKRLKFVARAEKFPRRKSA
jgi:hypothetical protein